ncbi:uncharacterized protein LOC103520207 [Diaphorina citri]|uniref:Uncharacterized protein LOC103520207 n=1 Tax=Diaphorina citri TaxID=121845 RepID=A0A3Q0JFR8_DIACI|nr:uncharacterized protein LOC103520207 [Diaphorina citri]
MSSTPKRPTKTAPMIPDSQKRLILEEVLKPVNTEDTEFSMFNVHSPVRRSPRLQSRGVGVAPPCAFSSRTRTPPGPASEDTEFSMFNVHSPVRRSPRLQSRGVGVAPPCAFSSRTRTPPGPASDYTAPADNIAVMAINDEDNGIQEGLILHSDPEVLRRLDNIDRNIATILFKLNEKEASVSSGVSPPEHDSVQGVFPMRSMEDVENVERRLKEEPEFKSSVEKTLQRIKGKDLRQTTLALLHHTIHNRLAECLCWGGSREKVGLAGFECFSSILLDSIFKNHSGQKKDALIVVQNWFKNAKRRH